MSLDVYLKVGDDEVFSANVTHNLNSMAEEAGVYKHLWRPEEIGITKAGQLVGPLRNALELMCISPGRFERFNPENGWGSYSGFLPWIAKYCEACALHPDAIIHVSR